MHALLPPGAILEIEQEGIGTFFHVRTRKVSVADLTHSYGLVAISERWYPLAHRAASI